MSGQYPEVPDGYELAIKTKPEEFLKHYTGRRFLTRNRSQCPSCYAGSVEVYGYGLEHICWAQDRSMAEMIADALELAAEQRSETK
jgi:hypothetical protein